MSSTGASTNIFAAIPAQFIVSSAADRVLSSQAPLLEGERMGVGITAALTLVLQGFLHAEHIGTGVSVLQGSTGNFSKLWHALYPISAAVCSPVKPAFQVKKVEQETGRKAQPATASQSPISWESNWFGNADFM